MKNSGVAESMLFHANREPSYRKSRLDFATETSEVKGHFLASSVNGRRGFARVRSVERLPETRVNNIVLRLNNRSAGSAGRWDYWQTRFNANMRQARYA